jgi:hypothetical protein
MTMVSDRNYLIHTKDGNRIITADEILENVKSRIENGEKPQYRTDGIDSKGFLIWSTYHDGAGVAFIREDNKIFVVTGWQGEFYLDLGEVAA